VNNIKYTLINSNRSIQFVDELNLSLSKKDDFLSDADCHKGQINDLKLNIQYIESQLHSDHIDEDYLYKRWLRVMNMDSLSYNEALCTLLGIPIDLTNKFIHVDLSKKDIESELGKCCAEYEFYNTDENDYLKRRFSHNSIDTKKFIDWAIEKHFIKYVDKNNSKYGFSEYNNHKSRAKQKNTEVIVKALENYPGNSTPNALLKSEKTEFYKKLKDSLVTKEPDGDEKPSPKTLLNYLSENNNSK
jgi:hypothetical protein